MTNRKLPPGIREHHGKYQVRVYGPNGERITKHFAQLEDAKKYKRNKETDRDRREWLDPGSPKSNSAIWRAVTTTAGSTYARPRVPPTTAT
jgi:hypothetical protein